MPGPRPIQRPQARKKGTNIVGMAAKAWRAVALGRKPVPRGAVKRARQARP